MAVTDARPVPRKNAAFRHYFAIRKNDGTLLTGWAGQDSEVSLDSGTFADCTNEATEIGASGVGYLDLTASEMNADAVNLKITLTNTGALPLVVTFFPEESGDFRVDQSSLATSASISALATAASLTTVGTAVADAVTRATNIQSRIPDALVAGAIKSHIVDYADDLAPEETPASAASLALVAASVTDALDRTTDIQSRIPDALVGGFLKSQVMGYDSSLSNSEDLVAAMVDAILDEALSGHATPGTVGAGISAAGSSGDPLATLVPGSYASGTAGRKIGDYLDAAVSSRMPTFTYTSPPSAAAVATVVWDTAPPETPLSTIAAAVRTEMDDNSTKLARLDVNLSTRLAASGYSPAPTAAAIRAEIDTNSTKLDVAVSTRATAGGITQAEIDLIAAGVVAQIGDQQADSPGVTTLLARLTSTRATKLDFLDVAVSTRMATFTYAAPPSPSAIATQVDATMASRFANLDVAVSTRFSGGAVSSVTNPVTVGTNNDKTNYSLSASGLDSVSSTMNGVPTTFVQKLMWVFHEKWRATRSKETGVKTVFGTNGSAATVQNTTNTDTVQTISAGTAP